MADEDWLNVAWEAEALPDGAAWWLMRRIAVNHPSSTVRAKVMMRMRFRFRNDLRLARDAAMASLRAIHGRQLATHAELESFWWVLFMRPGPDAAELVARLWTIETEETPYGYSLAVTQALWIVDAIRPYLHLEGPPGLFITPRGVCLQFAMASTRSVEDTNARCPDAAGPIYHGTWYHLSPHMEVVDPPWRLDRPRKLSREVVRGPDYSPW